MVFLGIALQALLTYMRGNGAQEKICILSAKDAPCNDPGVSRALIEKHEGTALLALVFMEFTGAFAWLGLWRYRPHPHFHKGVLESVCIPGCGVDLRSTQSPAASC